MRGLFRHRFSGPMLTTSQKWGAVETTPPAGPPKQARLAYFPTLGGFAETPVHDRYALRPGTRFEGPAIVEERESTLVVGPGQAVEVAADLSLAVTLRGA